MQGLCYLKKNVDNRNYYNFFVIVPGIRIQNLFGKYYYYYIMNFSKRNYLLWKHKRKILCQFKNLTQFLLNKF